MMTKVTFQITNDLDQEVRITLKPDSNSLKGFKIIVQSPLKV
jgi:hypothetical protein